MNSMLAENYSWHYDYMRLARDSGFRFEINRSKRAFNERELGLLNIDKIIIDRDIESVEQFIPSVLEFSLNNEQTNVLELGFVKMFRLSQLSLEYLLFCKKYLDNTVVLLKQELRSNNEENRKLQQHMSQLQTEVLQLKKNAKEAKYQVALPNIPLFQCPTCSKTFTSEYYLSAHVKRRHIEPVNDSIQEFQTTETVKLQLELKKLKEQLNNTEKYNLDEMNEVRNSTKVVHNEYPIVVKKIDKGTNTDIIKESSVEVEKVQKATNTETVEKEVEKFQKATNTDFSEPKVQCTQKATNTEERKVELLQKGTNTEDCTNMEQLNNEIFECIEQKFEFLQRYLQDELKLLHENKDQKRYEQLHAAIIKEFNDLKEEKKASSLKRSEILLRNLSQGDDTIGRTPLIVATAMKKELKPPPVAKRKSISFLEEKLSPKEVDKKITEISVMELTSESSSSEKRLDVKPSTTSTLAKRSVSSLKKVAFDREVLDGLRTEVLAVVDSRLGKLGISPEWTTLPDKSYRRALNTVRHQVTAIRKKYHNYDTIQVKVMKEMQHRLNQ